MTRLEEKTPMMIVISPFEAAELLQPQSLMDVPDHFDCSTPERKNIHKNSEA
jgi:hypothetical protein